MGSCICGQHARAVLDRGTMQTLQASLLHGMDCREITTPLAASWHGRRLPRSPRRFPKE